MSLRLLLGRLVRRGAGRTTEPPAADADTVEADSADVMARQALAMMMEEAVGFLRQVNLPCRPGFYRWNPHQSEWSFLSAALTPAARWGMVLETPAGEGWRYAPLPHVVRHLAPGDDAVRLAAEVLEQGAACLTAADLSRPAALAPTVRLAVAWADFQVVRSGQAHDRRDPLKLYFPADEALSAAPPATPQKAPLAKRKPAPKPRKTRPE